MLPPGPRLRSFVSAAGASAGVAAVVLCAGTAVVLPRAAAAQVAAPPARPATAGIVPDETEGLALIAAAKLPDGIAALARAERIYRTRADRAGQARVAQRQASTLRRLARFDEAVTAATRALALADDDLAIRVSALTELGLLANDRGDNARAETWLQQALPLAEQRGDGVAEAAVQRALGRVHETRGRSVDGLAAFERSIAAADRAGDLAARVSGRVFATVSLLALARYDDALARAQQASDLARDSTSPSVRADALFNQAQAQGHVWNLDRAAELWTAAIDAHRQAGNIRSVALATKQSVDTSFARGDFGRAVADGEQAVDLLRQVEFDQFVPETLARLALSQARLGRLESARARAAEAREVQASAPEARHIFIANDLGLTALELGDLTQARAAFLRVLDVATKIGNTEYEWRGWWGLGRVNDASGDRDGARDALERAIAIVERLRQTIPDAALRATFMTNRVGPYESLVMARIGDDTTIEPDQAQRALHAAERARSRALADLLAEARARPSDARLQAVRDREIAFGRRLTAATRRVADAVGEAARTAALTDLRTLERDYDDFVLAIRRDDADYAALAHPRALEASEIAGMLAPDEALVEFLLTETRGVAWVVRRGRVTAYRVPGQNALLPRARLLQALVAANDVDALQRLGGELYAQLLAPAASALDGVRRLVLVPDGVLQRVPFALLRAEGRWLVERFTLTVAPSATVLDHLRRSPNRAASRPLLAMAAPDAPDRQAALFELAPGTLGALRFASAEAAEAASRLGAGPEDAPVGPAATEQRLKAATAAQYRIVHLAAHAIVDEVMPRRSAVLLAPGGDDDGVLRVSEIANLPLAADLVVLAACRSNVGRLVRGEGLLSLSRAFLHAGARAVMATAWTVDDRETAWLMGEFYRGLADGQAPDEALQRAQQRALASGGAHASPAHWGAFVLIGDARTPIVTTRTTPPMRRVLMTAGAAGGVLVFGWWVRRSRRRSAHAEAR